MRVFVPVSWAQLDELTRGTLEVASGHAVTDEVRAELEGSDEDELAYVVLGMAASDAIVLAGDRRRRVVLAVDIDATPTGALSEVSLGAMVSLRDVAAIHVDSEEASADVAAAADAPDDERLAERALEHELGWYGVQELPDLLAGPV
ncbi:MAG TPA: hypothetical protein VLI04_04740 [Nocardioidaceae bacterium]|nr:hypothetical protein [Nocardioidaceae bacterium]